jgi:NAD(P)-dependent dehydrogenase (short-subunit alcohol dehydrogenase family)
MRLRDKVAIVVGAGQTPGDTIGNGRATALLFAREGASVMLVDRDLASAEETAALIRDEGGTCATIEADVRSESDCHDFCQATVASFGRIDILHNNVGIGRGDAGASHIDELALQNIFDVNLKGTLLSCKHALPIMRKQLSGSIINISSVAAVCAVGMTAYKTSKAAVNALTHSIAMGNARYNIRANVIMPGLMNTPMAIEGISRERGVSKADLIRERDARVPLGGKMGSAWDVAWAAVYLASEEARFVTGVMLPVDGGQSARIG